MDPGRARASTHLWPASGCVPCGMPPQGCSVPGRMSGPHQPPARGSRSSCPESLAGSTRVPDTGRAGDRWVPPQWPGESDRRSRTRGHRVGVASPVRAQMVWELSSANPSPREAEWLFPKAAVPSQSPRWNRFLCVPPFVLPFEQVSCSVRSGLRPWLPLRLQAGPPGKRGAEKRTVQFMPNGSAPRSVGYSIC